MRLSSVQHGDGHSRAAVADGDDWVVLAAPDVVELVARAGWREEAAAAVRARAGERIPAASATLLRPLRRPAKIICCGLNYRDHIRETGRETPVYPTLFAKFADTLTDPTATIDVSGSTKVDWEAELGVIVGSAVSRASRAAAAESILGYTVANDVSFRDWQARTLQWFQGKAWDHTTPVGPVVVTSDEISPADGLEIQALIGDEIVQSSNTRELLFDAADLVSYVSQFTRLAPGDLILTGTPSGVGLGRDPQRWLADGDVLTTRIEGIGQTRNPFRIDSAPLEQNGNQP